MLRTLGLLFCIYSNVILHWPTNNTCTPSDRYVHFVCMLHVLYVHHALHVMNVYLYAFYTLLVMCACMYVCTLCTYVSTHAVMQSQAHRLTIVSMAAPSTQTSMRSTSKTTLCCSPSSTGNQVRVLRILDSMKRRRLFPSTTKVYSKSHPLQVMNISAFLPAMVKSSFPTRENIHFLRETSLPFKRITRLPLMVPCRNWIWCTLSASPTCQSATRSSSSTGTPVACNLLNPSLLIATVQYTVSQIVTLRGSHIISMTTIQMAAMQSGDHVTMC